ncbi:MAG: sulfatase-like hydrolase/transferase [Gammaproteobacteria bacterium]|nr:sulfatase-like hydrolase/transferase [Gammaproteobacteria bacterium]
MSSLTCREKKNRGAADFLTVGVCAALLVTAPSVAWSYEADAAQFRLQKDHAERWAKEDRGLNQRLASLRRTTGQPPNVVFILSDDIGWGELGSYGGGKLRGTPTPNLDQLAADGMRFLQHYSEPSCTVTRAALMTGRLAVRTGLDIVLFPGQKKGLVADEVTLAELLSAAGYRTAMFGKWHLGENAENHPTEQGFDYAFYTLVNGGVWPWRENAEFFDADNEVVGEIPYNLDMPKDYEQVFGVEIPGIYESRKGGTPREVAELSLKRYNRHDNELTDKLIGFVEESVKAEQSFFAYFASNAQQVFACPPEERDAKYVDSNNCQAAQLYQHDKNIARIREKLKELGIAENTLLVWASDNGPMYGFYPSAGFSYLRGRKHEVREGGVRTPAIAWWPGTITAGSEPIDLVHVTDWYTTIARLTGASKYVPTDRIIDGVDQSALLFNGEGHSRRDYLFLYKYGVFGSQSRSRLEAVRWRNIKFYPATYDIYNVMRDPNERFSNRRQYLWAMEPMLKMVDDHQARMDEFPNRKLGP